MASKNKAKKPTPQRKKPLRKSIAPKGNIAAKENIIAKKRSPSTAGVISSSRVARQQRLLRAVRLAAGTTIPHRRPNQLERHEGNPIIEPREGNYWEMKATFNPGAIYADHRVHLLYRAIGGDDISVLGYAASSDGVSFAERSGDPAYMPTAIKSTVPAEEQKPLEPAYFSGGGWNGGVEDPRLTLIDDTVYLTYTAFDGWGSIRIALSSIALEDFLNKNWKWKKPTMISPRGEVHKNWVLFPEKIDGKFAILHSISPQILVDYVDDLNDFDEEEAVIRSKYSRVSNTGGWDTWIRGAGPPPLKTKDGWLLLYHAMDLADPDRYKLGAMLLDLNDPTKVLYRSRGPILEPDFDYENRGLKSGVVYSCGAVIADGELYVYYGGADSVTCVAMANLEKFLHELKAYGAPRLGSEHKANAKRTNGRS
jgi:beta-1,2-mannobiose phosphorylase / 1,2-beta-oligomannan phosphorylase